ncbi:MAG TPA: hypothetical protein VK213_01970 [Bacteroidales bacterium]|nr:hypothetical protein [Bacteroidales bacterium]
MNHASYDHLIHDFTVIAQYPSKPVSSRTLLKNRNLAFLDTLKIKSSRNKITRKIYEIVIVAPDSINNRNIRGDSEYEYSRFSGKRIRNIEIRSLPVFGSNINNPDYYNPYNSQKILNKTHVSTSEYIIKNNLLFSSGDTISPIILSDNERLLRDLPFIDDARIFVMPAGNDEADILVVTKDVYSLGGSFSPFGFKKGKLSVFDNNILGLGNELGFQMPFDNTASDSPGIGTYLRIDNPARTFANLRLYYNDDIGENSYGIDISRRFLTSTTKYAGGLTISRVNKNKALDTMRNVFPLKYVYQDYWLSRSVLMDKESVTRMIFSARYTVNNVFTRPEIGPDTYHSLQKYRTFLGSVAFSRQRYFKSSLIHEYGRNEDIPYGMLAKVTFGRELNEFKIRNYAGSELAYGKSFSEYGYLYVSAGLGAYLNKNRTEQGIMTLKTRYFSNLLPLGKYMVRSFININYTRGFDRNLDENLHFFRDNGFSGFRNDSVHGKQRLTLNIETVLFSPVNIYGFRFAFFGFADISSLSGTNQILSNGTILTGVGLGLRVRNDNLIFNTFQIRIGFFPDPPQYSRIDHLILTGEQPLRFDNFESGPPSMIPYR